MNRGLVYLLGTGASVETPMVSQMEDFTSFRASGPTAFSGAASQGRDHVIFAKISVHQIGIIRGPRSLLAER